MWRTGVRLAHRGSTARLVPRALSLPRRAPPPLWETSRAAYQSKERSLAAPEVFASRGVSRGDRGRSLAMREPAAIAHQRDARGRRAGSSPLGDSSRRGRGLWECLRPRGSLGLNSDGLSGVREAGGERHEAQGKDTKAAARPPSSLSTTDCRLPTVDYRLSTTESLRTRTDRPRYPWVGWSSRLPSRRLPGKPGRSIS